MGSMSGKSRFLCTDERAKCEGRRVITHASRLLWHRGWFHKNRIFDERGKWWGFRRVTFTSLWIGTVERSTRLGGQGRPHAEGGVGGFSGEVWRKLHGNVTRDGKR